MRLTRYLVRQDFELMYETLLLKNNPVYISSDPILEKTGYANQYIELRHLYFLNKRIVLKEREFLELIKKDYIEKI